MDILEALIEWQILPELSQVKLLVCPDYLFFRQAPLLLHTEFKGFPRLSKSLFSPTNSESISSECALSHLFICDGNSALRTIEKTLPWINHLPISSVGCRIDFFDLPLLNPESIESEIDFDSQSFFDINLLSDMKFPINPVEGA
ncbi:MAG: hypothetical protein ACFFBD_01100, partial [Candidatus Hodarchaeota archaeon]